MSAVLDHRHSVLSRNGDQPRYIRGKSKRVLNHNCPRLRPDLLRQIIGIHVGARRFNVNVTGTSPEAQHRFRHGNACERLNENFVAAAGAKSAQNRGERNAASEVSETVQVR